MIRVPNTCNQRAADRFERRDPFPRVPMVCDDAQSFPSMRSAMVWLLIWASLMAFLYFVLATPELPLYGVR